MSKKLLVALLCTNAITLAMLVAVCTYYRVPQKAYRRIAVESRVPGVSENFQSNRFYTTSRELSDLYDSLRNDNDAVDSNVDDTRILVVGDSQVSLVNWNELLNEYDAFGRGIPGDTAAGLAFRIADYQSIQPQTCVVLIGTNDILTDRSSSETHDAYRRLVSTGLDNWPDADMALVSVPPLFQLGHQGPGKERSC